MKGLILLFIATAAFGIGWRYASKDSRKMVVSLIRNNIVSILGALLVVAIAIFFSVNTTMRLV